MCDDKNDENTQKIRIVKFDRAIPIIQLFALVGAIILLGATLVDNDVSRIFLAMGLMVILAGIAWQVGRLYRRGITLEIQYVDEEHSTRHALVAEEVPDTDEDSMSEENIDEKNSADEEIEKEKHWTEQNYPDPDVELGLKDPPKETPEDPQGE